LTQILQCENSLRAKKIYLIRANYNELEGAAEILPTLFEILPMVEIR